MTDAKPNGLLLKFQSWEFIFETNRFDIVAVDESQEGDGEQDGKVMLPEGFIFSISYMVSVGGAIVLLLCLLFIGLIVQPGKLLMGDVSRK